MTAPRVNRQNSILALYAHIQRRSGRFVRSLFSKLCPSTRKPVEEDKSRLQVLYFQSAIQYLIAGRFSAIAWFSPVAGNLLHHAIELYLKGALVAKLDENERRKFRHDIRKLWRRYKAETKDSSLDRFDQTIDDLHRFERIRYPEEVAARGMISEVGFVRNNAVVSFTPRLPPRYQLAVDEIDQLIEAIFRASGLNALFFLYGLQADALGYLKKQNSTSMWEQ